jgi:hypothetical protein
MSPYSIPKAFLSIVEDYKDDVITKQESWELAAKIIQRRVNKGIDSSEIIFYLNKELR